MDSVIIIIEVSLFEVVLYIAYIQYREHPVPLYAATVIVRAPFINSDDVIGCMNRI